MSVTFAKCPHCRPDARPGRMYGSGVCLFHFQNPPKKDEKPVIVKPSPAEVAAITEVRKPTKKELDAWFKMQLQQRPRCCEFPGCEARLITTGTWQQKANVAHIIPKRHFWSVALHPLNRLFLCKTPHHDDYDSSWDKATQMRVWPLAVERFKEFMHLITDTELRFLPQALRELTNR